ncbi:unnamed protein product [Durusdinium trenchii]|uniref:Uncharacterized protein n=1 Tax=Durusdinium trenchii TaxID=1381693 RepID=A0ABP0M251_9DINO
MTKSELVQKFGSVTVAEAIISAKEHDEDAKRNQIRAHPDLHGLDTPETRQYLVWDSEGSEDSEDTVCSELFKAAENGASDSVTDNKSKSKKAKKKDSKKKRKSSSSDDSSAADSDDSSSASSSSSEAGVQLACTHAKKKRKKGKKSKKSSKNKSDKKDKKQKMDKECSEDGAKPSGEEKPAGKQETDEQKRKRELKEAEDAKKKQEKEEAAAKLKAQKEAEKEKNTEFKKDQRKGTQALQKINNYIATATSLEDKLHTMSLGQPNWVGNLERMPEMITEAGRFGDVSRWCEFILGSLSWDARALGMRFFCIASAFVPLTLEICSHRVARLLLCEDFQYYGAGTFAEQLDVAYRDFVGLCRARRIKHSQPPFLPRMVKKKDGTELLTAKAFNGRLILSWLSHTLLVVLQQHPDHELLILTSAAMTLGVCVCVFFWGGWV